jgi:hypothetical protein
MTHAILQLNRVAATDNSYLNRSAVSGSDIDNGWIFLLNSQNTTTGMTEVFDALQPTTGSLTSVWMACAPEIVTVTSGANKYRGIDPDPRNFYTSASTVFDAFKPIPGDIITLTADALDSGTAQAYAVCSTTTYKWTWSATPLGTSVACLRYLSTNYISMGMSGSAVGATQRATSFKFEVLYN